MGAVLNFVQKAIVVTPQFIKYLSQVFSARDTYPEQIVTIQRNAPWVLGINAVIVAIIWVLFVSTEMAKPATVWAVFGIFLTIFSVFNLIKSRAKSLDVDKLPLITNYLTGFAAIRGLHWAVGMALFMPGADSVRQIALGWVLAGMMCGGNFAYSTLPRAAFAYVGILAVGGVLAFLATGTSALILIALALMIFAGFLLTATISNTKLLRDHIQHEKLLAEQNEFMSVLLKDFEEGATDWLWEATANGQLRRGATRFSQNLNCPLDELQQLSVLDFVRARADNEKQSQSVEGLAKAMAARVAFADILVNFGKGEDERFWKFSAKPASGATGGWRGVLSDVTASEQSQNHIAYLAHHDALTGLPNRVFFRERLAEAIVECSGNPVERFAMCLDLDGFKNVNDTYGHQMGDRLLIAVSKRFAKALGPSDILARMGGDEFSIIHNTAGDDNKIEDFALKLLDAVVEPFDINGQNVFVGVSIGIARVGEDGDTVSDLLRHADLALYRAKNEGRGAACIFEESMDHDMRAKRQLELDLKRAIVMNEFVLHYQPIIALATSEICGYEALIRWQHPTLGLVAPLEFIPMAEETGLIVQIGEWVIQQACRQAKSWPQNVRVSINLAAQQIKSTRCVASIVKALADTGLRPSQLEVEITESSLLENTAAVLATLQNLKTLGVRVGLDDFGTGYSSLGYLHQFKFDNIKIDRSFVQAMADRPESAAVVRAVLGLAEDLGISTTAEGIETVEQLNALKLRGCNEAQGFYLGRPAPMAALEDQVLMQA